MRSDSPPAITRNTSRGPAHIPFPRLRGPLMLGLVMATSALGLGMMLDILRVGGITPLEVAILAIFTVTFGWISVAFWSAIIGFLLLVAGRDPLSLQRSTITPPSLAPGRARTVLVMPIHNESPVRVAAGIESTCRAIAEHPLVAHGDFEAFLLSDTTDAAIAEDEARTIAALQSRLGDVMPIHYRRRDRNSGRKAGNIADFCRQWGARYDYMIVLDADSILSGDCAVELVQAMQARPATGIIQTTPTPRGQSTLFGRCLQFAADLHGPVLAAGTSFWQGDSANYWGHNAIIRIAAFTRACGLPELAGHPPLGGAILSHDFVEAALMRRAGWGVELHTEIQGSYEEIPGNLVDYAARDRRWLQGNLQHLRLLPAPGLKTSSRVHFLLGATAYLSSLLWLLMLGASTADAVARATAPERYFSSGYQLFPNWPVDKTEVIVSLLLITIGLLLLPKLLALVHALLARRAAFGGGARLLGNAVLEIVVSALLAPVMMLCHAIFILEVLAGRNVSWTAQRRDRRAVDWSESIRHALPATLVGLLWGGLALGHAPGFLLWLTPVLAGLLLSAPLIHLGASHSPAGSPLFASTVELSPPSVLRMAETLAGGPCRSPGTGASLTAPPSPRPMTMPRQHLGAATAREPAITSPGGGAPQRSAASGRTPATFPVPTSLATPRTGLGPMQQPGSGQGARKPSG